jgi:hypothetical protein
LITAENGLQKGCQELLEEMSYFTSQETLTLSAFKEVSTGLGTPLPQWSPFLLSSEYLVLKIRHGGRLLLVLSTKPNLSRQHNPCRDEIQIGPSRFLSRFKIW